VIEVLFLERFVQLARPGGKVAIILPEGVFANSNLRYVREWLVQNFTIHAVVGLPRDTFKGTGTTAKTAILYLEKCKPPEGHQVLLAEVGRINPNGQPNPELEVVLDQPAPGARLECGRRKANARRVAADRQAETRA